MIKISDGFSREKSEKTSNLSRKYLFSRSRGSRGEISSAEEKKDGVTFGYLSDALASNAVQRSLSKVIDLLMLTSSKHMGGTRRPAHERSAEKLCHREYMSANFRMTSANWSFDHLSFHDYHLKTLKSWEFSILTKKILLKYTNHEV